MINILQHIKHIEKKNNSDIPQETQWPAPILVNITYILYLEYHRYPDGYKSSNPAKAHGKDKDTQNVLYRSKLYYSLNDIQLSHTFPIDLTQLSPCPIITTSNSVTSIYVGHQNRTHFPFLNGLVHNSVVNRQNVC